MVAPHDSPFIDERLLARKTRLEIEMRKNSRDFGLRSRYFRVLSQVAESHLGLFFAVLPEIRTPLMFRGGSSDVLNMQQIYLNQWEDTHDYSYGEYGFDVLAPARILDLGAYAGYTSVYFANRFEQAEILAIEPPGSSFNTLRANTGSYPNIRCLAAGVWHRTTWLAMSENQSGEWGRALVEATDGNIRGYAIGDILRLHDWPSADFIKCVIEGAEVAVLTSPDRPWLDGVNYVATKPGPQEAWADPEDEIRVRTAFPEADFETRRHGNLFLFARRGLALSAAPTTVRVIPPASRTCRFTFDAGGELSTICAFDKSAIHLTPNRTGEPAASATFFVVLAGHTRFQVKLASDPGPDGEVTFAVRVWDDETGTTAGESRQTLPVGASQDLSVALPAISGRHCLLLAAEETGGRIRDHAHSTYFIDPRFE